MKLTELRTLPRLHRVERDVRAGTTEVVFRIGYDEHRFVTKENVLEKVGTEIPESVEFVVTAVTQLTTELRPEHNSWMDAATTLHWRYRDIPDFQNADRVGDRYLITVERIED